MQFKSLVFAAIAATAVSAQSSSDACAAGAIIGINALCGSNPTDCGSSKCCLAGQKCVKVDGNIACADSQLVASTTVTVNAACYGTKTASASASATASKSGGQFAESSPTASSSSGPSQGAGGYGGSKPSSTGSGYSVPFTNATVTSGGFATPSSTSSRGPVLATANAALSAYSSPNSNFAALLSVMGVFAYLL